MDHCRALAPSQECIDRHELVGNNFSHRIAVYSFYTIQSFSLNLSGTFKLFVIRRVRHNLAKAFSDVVISLNLNENPELYQNQKALTMACFVSLLQDAEGEVRAGAVGHLAPMVHWGGAVLFQSHLASLLPALADDVVVDVRSKCALALMDSSEGGTLSDATIVKCFTPLLESFLLDEYPEVQLHVLNNLSRISHLLHQMSGVVSNILNMSKATNWRVREGVARILPHLADARGMDFFSSVLLEPAWMALLTDPVASVREACVSGVAQLVTVAGDEWTVSNLLPHHLKIYGHSESAYLMRMTILRAHAQMAIASKAGSLFYQVVELLLEKGLKDKVANVRMVAAKGLRLICSAGSCDEDIIASKIKPTLEACLAREEDPDCVDVLRECLDCC
jgi:serine/threonine-protein phosphatase 2A regulatory subunit A